MAVPYEELLRKGWKWNIKSSRFKQHRHQRWEFSVSMANCQCMKGEQRTSHSRDIRILSSHYNAIAWRNSCATQNGPEQRRTDFSLPPDPGSFLQDFFRSISIQLKVLTSSVGIANQNSPTIHLRWWSSCDDEFVPSCEVPASLTSFLPSRRPIWHDVGVRECYHGIILVL